MGNKTLEEKYALMTGFDWNVYEDALEDAVKATPEYKLLEETREALEGIWNAVRTTPKWKAAEKAWKTWEKLRKAQQEREKAYEEAKKATPEYEKFEEAKKALEEAEKMLKATPKYKAYKKVVNLCGEAYCAYWNEKEAMWGTPEYEKFEKACRAYRSARNELRRD